MAVRIMSWNVNLDLNATNLISVASLIAAEDPDLVAMQQSRQERLRNFTSADPNSFTDPNTFYGYLRSNRWPDRGNGRGTIFEHHTTTIGSSTGITTVSRVPLSGTTALWVGRAEVLGTTGYQEKRHIQRALATLPSGGQFYIFNTHLSANGPGVIDGIDQPGVDQRVTAYKFAVGLPVGSQASSPPLSGSSRRIVAGDFNTDPGAMPSNTWVTSADAPWRDFDDPDTTPTIPSVTRSPANPDYPVGNKRDYIFRLNGTDFSFAMPVSYKRIVENKVSDHKAIVADISGV